MKIVALLTSHNRRDLTLRCLESFFSQRLESNPRLEAIVVDDGSTDGTGDAVLAAFDAAQVIRGDGTLFWARGMQLAESHAVSGRPEFLLWLNDDVVLEPWALEHLLATATTCPDAVIVGGLLDPETSVVTYSGVVMSRWHPLRTRFIEPVGRPREADAFNGNAVLVPRLVYERVGPIDGVFSHAQADFDYGLRARKAGFRVIVAPRAVGTCRRGEHRPFADTTLPLRRRWELIQSPKGIPMGSHARYLRRHGGPLWPLYWAVPYVRLVLSAFFAAVGRRLLRRA